MTEFITLIQTIGPWHTLCYQGVIKKEEEEKVEHHNFCESNGAR